MVNWIMKCVSTTSFSLNVNRELHGFFQGKRGLRQGDPLSLYLFTIVMEVLTLMLKREVSESELFKYHLKCDKLEIVNLCFADDLFLLSCTYKESVMVIANALEEFKLCSGLVPTLPKSTVFLANCSIATKN
ncbi:uncharacterized mitochondrial protein AtMg01250-like [Rutidosis leptorrhynchoides]|uniref:uncharacterized mitochondrial protein AtMg01250-like n=1 Tax=Rutidosis leptorrhynchoides TaxID=125765 RepID=UPI003A990B9E